MRYLAFQHVIRRSTVESLLRALKGPDAPQGVYVDSPGGEFEHFSVLGPAIERRGIVTLSGDVRSAAVILFLFGHRRRALPDATFFFHEVRTLVGPQGEIAICDLEHVLEYQEWMSGHRREAFQEWLRQMRGAQAWFLDFLHRKTGVDTGTFVNLMRSEATLSAQEAVRYGIVHEVLPEGALLRS